MKLHYVLFLAVIVLLSGCSTTKSYVLSYEQSAALAIEKAIIDMNLPAKLSGTVSPSDMITFGSIEEVTTSDADVIVAVEDAVIRQFVNSGYKVLERDFDQIHKNWIDSGKINGANLSFKFQEGMKPAYEVTKNGAFELTPATKVVTYRINELGIMYTPIKNSAGYVEVVTRNARVIMNVRVENPATNQILYSNTFEGNYEDVLPNAHARNLENIHYRFHPYNYPVSNPNRRIDDTGKLIDNSQETQRKGCM
jgi:curli biogenesis system outer membrane secretion channel CsgG